MPVAVFLDESRPQKHHPILSVGGFVCDLADLPRLEAAWEDAKKVLRVPPAGQLRYAMSWPDRADRLRLIERIPRLGVPISAVAALLEDFRPERMRQTKQTRGDMYVYRWAFAYVLQRLPSPST